MKAKFPNIVERGRVVGGEMSSPAGSTYGFFFVKHPRTGQRFKVQVGDIDWDHVSVSLPKRCPTWDEMCWIKSLFFEPDECVVQYHPPASNYVNICSTCLHLWRPQDRAVPMPPLICV